MRSPSRLTALLLVLAGAGLTALSAACAGQTPRGAASSPVPAAPAAAAPSAEPRPDALASGIDSLIGQRLVVGESETIFTVFALLNLAGYDDESSPSGMNPVRVNIRQRLKEITPALLQAKLTAYYHQHLGVATTSTYALVAAATSGGPRFEWRQVWAEVDSVPPYRDLAGLPELLREFYTAVRADTLYRSVRGEYQAWIKDYTRAIHYEVAKAYRYCRVSSVADLAGGGELEEAYIVPNLMESYGRALSYVLGGAFYSVEGPQRPIGYNPHQFIHCATNPISYDTSYAGIQRGASMLLDAARTRVEIGDHFKSVAEFFDECLVRAIALRYPLDTNPARVALARAAMLREWKSGYLLERLFYDQLTDFEHSGETLRAFYPHMLERLNPEAELNRWRRESGAH